MDRKQKVQLLQAITAGQLTIKKAVAVINNAGAEFYPLVGMDLAEYQDGLIPEGTILINGIAGRMEIKSDLPEVEIYL